MSTVKYNILHLAYNAWTYDGKNVQKSNKYAWYGTV